MAIALRRSTSKRKNMNFAKALTWLRLSLGGTVLGISLATLFSSYFGVHDVGAAQSVGALSGTALAATLVKVVHLV